MAATRVMTTAAAASANQTKLCLFTKRPFVLPTRKVCAFNCLCCNKRASLVVKSKKPCSCNAIYNPQVQTIQEGQSETLDYRVFFQDGSGKKWKFLKSRDATDEAFTPIKQDTKKGKLRYYPYNINWNYGLFPQTWEDPTLANSEVEGAFGENDPVDVVEIGESQRKIGEVLKVKPLAALAMIDEGELDWKIVAVSLDDPKAHLVNDVDDVEKHFPGTLTAIRDWFRDYKIPDGKPANKFGLGNKPTNKDYALKIIHETNESWAKLVKRSVSPGDLSLF
ncbi:unnamed protein product [Arabidopsis halleri]